MLQMEMYVVQHQRRKAKTFAAALDEWDAFKEYADMQFSKGCVSKDKYDKMLADKAKELDL